MPPDLLKQRRLDFRRQLSEGPGARLHDPPMTREAHVARSWLVDGARREVGRGLVVLLEDVGVEAEGDHHRGVAETFRDDLGRFTATLSC